jgi:uncharacterized membrane protein
MTPSSILFGFVVVLYAAGIAIIAAAIPLYLRRIPPNMFYGVRFSWTLDDEHVWYEINERGGRDFILLGALYLAVLTVSFMFGRTWSIAFRVLAPMAVLAVGLVIDAVILGVAASRLAAERRSGEVGHR